MSKLEADANVVIDTKKLFKVFDDLMGLFIPAKQNVFKLVDAVDKVPKDLQPVIFKPIVGIINKHMSAMSAELNEKMQDSQNSFSDLSKEDLDKIKKQAEEELKKAEAEMQKGDLSID